MSFILYFCAEKAEEILADTLFKWVQHFLHRLKVLNDKGGLANFQLPSGVLGCKEQTRPALGAVTQRRNVVFLCLRFQESIKHCGPFSLETDVGFVCPCIS